MTLRYDGRVAVVTGAGAGLGRSYALLLASRGAKVVVNDLGGNRHGDGISANAADAVVKEIMDNGGVAVADYNSVVEGDKIIKTALDKFGRVDILINNAGILRDKSFPRISDQDWDLIQAVHLKGTFKTTQAAFTVFKNQKYGRVVNTASNSGIYGNFGQANYSAAKLGVVGLTNTVAIEGKKYNIHCNVIVPTAASRLTEDILPPDVFAELRPELIAPVVAYLCHESCTENGSVIDSALGWAGKLHTVRSSGTQLRSSASEPVTIEGVRDNWSKVVDMKKAKKYSNTSEVTGQLLASFQELKARKPGEKGSVEDVYSYNSRDVIVYALGIGATLRNPSDLQYLYESHADFKPLPSFFILPALQLSFTSNIVSKAMPPGKEANFTNILHGEQYLEIVGDLPSTDATVRTVSSVIAVLDKGSAAVAIVNAESFDEQNNLIFKTQSHVFVVGAGGFNGPRQTDKSVNIVNPPKRAIDAFVEQKTATDQAAIYRLSGDLNPLHIDPNLAKASGQPQPILHGLASLGFAVRHVLIRYANNDASLFKAVKARFAKPVLPGQTLRTEMWLDGNRVIFQTKVKETNTVVISGAYVDLKKIVHAKMVPELNSVSASGLSSDAVFLKIKEQVELQPDKAKSVNGVFLYHVLKDGKTVKHWTLDLKTPKVHEGTPDGKKADTTMFIADEDMVDIASGKLNPQVAFMKGKLKITGNLMLSQKLAPLLKSEAKL